MEFVEFNHWSVKGQPIVIRGTGLYPHDRVSLELPAGKLELTREEWGEFHALFARAVGGESIPDLSVFEYPPRPGLREWDPLLGRTVPAVEPWPPPRPPGPPRAGHPWDDQEDVDLVAAWERGDVLADLADGHERTEGAIVSRLVKLGAVADKPAAKASNRERIAAASGAGADKAVASGAGADKAVASGAGAGAAAASGVGAAGADAAVSSEPF